VLLVSYGQLKPVLEQKIGFKCKDCYMEDGAMEIIKNVLLDVKEKKTPAFFTYIMVDLDDLTIIIERFGRSIKRAFMEAKMDLSKVKLYAFATNASEKIVQHAERGGFTFFIKQADSEAQLQQLRHMAEND
jgi:hypothetical protein